MNSRKATWALTPQEMDDQMLLLQYRRQCQQAARDFGIWNSATPGSGDEPYHALGRASASAARRDAMLAELNKRGIL